MSRVRETKPGRSTRRSTGRWGTRSGWKDPNSDDELLFEIQTAINGEIEFGDPQDPDDGSSTSLAGNTATSHPGTLQNIHGVWVEKHITGVGRSTIACYHNLFQREPEYTLPVTGQPNVRWLNFGWQHDNTGTSGTTELWLNVWFSGGTVTANRIDLEVSVELHVSTITLGSDNPILLTLFFVPATRGE